MTGWGASKTLPGTLGLWALVVDAALCDACATSESLLATLIQDDDTEFRKLQPQMIKTLYWNGP